MRYTWITEKFLPIGEKLGQKGISAARAESISAARFLPGGEKRANTALCCMEFRSMYQRQALDLSKGFSKYMNLTRRLVSHLI